MNPTILFYLKEVGIPVLTSAIVVGILVLVIKKYFSGRIQLEFDERLATFKYKLDCASEQSRFDYQRKLQDFNLYTSKRHEAYIELHKHLLTACSSARNLLDINEKLDLSAFDRADVEKLLAKNQATPSQSSELLNNWVRDHAIGEIMINAFLKQQKSNEAKTAYCSVRDYYWESKLYLSDPVSGAVSGMIKKLWDFATLCNANNSKTVQMIDDARGIDELLNAIIFVMKKELSVGHYTNDNIPSVNR